MKATSLIFTFLIHAGISQMLSPIADIKTLSELPLEKLLEVKNSFNLQEQPSEEDKTSILKLQVREDNPEALPLQKPFRKGDYEVFEYEKEKKSIFAISVTGLAFAAFGGYLLCLIVSAVRAKSTMSNPTPANMTIAYIRPIRPNRLRPPRQKRPTRLPRYKRNAQDTKIVEAPGHFQEEMYDVLVSLAEGYKKYHVEERFYSSKH